MINFCKFNVRLNIVVLLSFLFFASTGKAETFQMELLQDPAPTVKVMIAGKAYRFVIDTGAHQTIVMPILAKTYGNIDPKKTVIAPGIGGNWHLVSAGQLEMRLAKSNYVRKIEIATVVDTASSTPLILETLKNYDGILGLDFFYGTEVVFDGQNQTFTVTEIPDTAENKTKQELGYFGNKIPSQRPVLIGIIGDVGFLVAIDTGMIHDKEIIFFNTPANKKIWDSTNHFSLDNRPDYSEQPMKLFGAPHAYLGKKAIGKMFILSADPEHASSPFTVFADLGRSRQLDAIIGWRIIKEGILTVNMNEPMKNTFVLPDNFQMPYNQSGLRISVWSENFNYLTKVIDADSPADIAGIQVGDEISKINGRLVTADSFIKDRDDLYGRNGSKVDITYIRNQIETDTSLDLFNYLFEEEHP